mmetsp:Transcript_10529/g.11967  ORF Transcript_10529/g.11967 Transcript_10529/m.11967 type:complete len:83 (-) Transcript_10529:62-310(-)
MINRELLIERIRTTHYSIREILVDEKAVAMFVRMDQRMNYFCLQRPCVSYEFTFYKFQCRLKPSSINRMKENFFVILLCAQM